MVKTIPMIKSEYLKFLKKHEIGKKPIIDKLGKLKTFYIPLSEWIYSIYKVDKKPKIIGLSGGQGAGKSTITAILKFLLKRKYGINLCIFSIDDFYKTKAERIKISRKIHPLFLVRGVPGTHDLSLINNTLKKLKKRDFKTVHIPKFDKSIDDRLNKNKWQKIKKRPDIIIFEGWCVGARNQKNIDLKKSLNYIEKEYDKDLIWRKTTNNYLKHQYKKIFHGRCVFSHFLILHLLSIPYETHIEEVRG